MYRKLIPLLAAAATGAMVALGTNLAGMSDAATMVIGALALIPVVLIGTPVAFGINPFGPSPENAGRDDFRRRNA